MNLYKKKRVKIYIIDWLRRRICLPSIDRINIRKKKFIKINLNDY